MLHVKDDFARSLAAYRLADVALVNPIRDGMNLVAKEVPVVSDEGCALVLSREAGAYEELGDDALVVNPYDVSATAEALHTALLMGDGERAERTEAARGRGDRAAARPVVPGPARRAAGLDRAETGGRGLPFGSGRTPRAQHDPNERP